MMFRESHKTELKINFEQSIVYLKIRRILEIFIIILCMPIISILFIFISLLVLIDSKGKIIYKQKRIGKKEKKFFIYKFQTLKNNEGDYGIGNKKNQNLSKFSSFLRNHRLDELPQILNVIKGDLNLIGPRPEIEEEYKKYKNEIEGYGLRKLIPQGITGLAQVNQPHSDTTDGNRIKLEYDLFYIQNVSFFLDIKIIIKTIVYIFRGRL